jgi:DNA-binding CsgD family transcriptional regulator
VKLESANLRSAMDQCFADPATVADGLHMAADLRNRWIIGHLGEGHRRLEQGLALHREPDEAQARALVVDGLMITLEGGPGAADALLDEAEEIGTRRGFPAVLADVALHRGLVALTRSDSGAAVAYCEDAIRRHRAIGDLMGRARGLTWLTAAHTLRDDLPSAVSAAEEGIALCESHGDDLYRTYLMTMLGIALWRRGDTARDLVKKSLDFHRMLGNPRGIGFGLAVLAWIAASDGEYERAARLLGILDTFSSGHGRALGDAAFEAELRRSGRLSIEEALAYALEEEAVTGDQPSPLTHRETEVARLVGQGMSNKEIAAELVISPRTAEGHVEHILTKLGFASRTQIAVWVNDRAGPGDRQGPARVARADPGGPRGIGRGE